MRKPKGHVRPHGTGYQAIVPVGLDPVTKRYRYAYRQAATREEAEALRDAMLADLAEGRQPRKEATLGQLLDAVLAVADLDVSARVLYQGHVEETLRPALGDYAVGYLEQHPELLDRLYAALGRCRRLCGGRRGLIDHRPPRRGERLADGCPDHECDEQCRPHQCEPAKPATVAQVHAIIEGAFGYAVRWQWAGQNPALSASPPAVSAGHDGPPPEAGEAIRLLAAAAEHSRVMPVITRLALVTGARRGELCALRWHDINEHESILLIGGTYAVRQGQRTVTLAKVHWERRVALDPGTVDLLAGYKEHCRGEALAAGCELDEDGFAFSADGLGQVPWHPDTISGWFRQVAKAAGVQATMHGLRHYDAAKLLSPGTGLRDVAGRPGHSGAGPVTLRVDAHPARSADQRAAELLAEQLRGV